MSDNLPRPSTPGPWEAVDDHNGDCGFACTPDGCLGHPSGERTLDGPEGHDGAIEFASEQDARAIAALPDWIAAYDALARRMDAVRGFAEMKAIAAHAVGNGDEERRWLDAIILIDRDGGAR